MNILTIDLSLCFECGEPKNDMHHIIPKSKGGTKMIPLCSKCHGLVHGRDFVKMKALQRIGIDKAKADGKHIGRKKDTKETNETILEKHNDIVVELLKNKSIRTVVRLTNKSLATTQKVRHILNDKGLLNKI